MKIAVGSTNPVKIQAVKNAVSKIWPSAEVIGTEVDHGTGVQPNSDEEAIQGATNRAKLSLQKLGADLGFGLEGNTHDTKHGMLMNGWIVVVDKNGTTGIASAGAVQLPEKVAAEVRKGKELGPSMDAFVGTHNVKQKQGTVGVLTNNLVTRTDAFEKGVIYALAKFLNPQYYK